MCKSKKIGYNSIRVAKKSAKYLLLSKKKVLYPYKCNHCGLYHLTKIKPEEKPKLSGKW